jgi:hypothetical protein
MGVEIIPKLFLIAIYLPLQILIKLSGFILWYLFFEIATWNKSWKLAVTNRKNWFLFFVWNNILLLNSKKETGENGMCQIEERINLFFCQHIKKYPKKVND